MPASALIKDSIRHKTGPSGKVQTIFVANAVLDQGASSHEFLLFYDMPADSLMKEQHLQQNCFLPGCGKAHPLLFNSKAGVIRKHKTQQKTESGRRFLHAFKRLLFIDKSYSKRWKLQRPSPLCFAYLKRWLLLGTSIIWQLYSQPAHGWGREVIVVRIASRLSLSPWKPK